MHFAVHILLLFPSTLATQLRSRQVSCSQEGYAACDDNCMPSNAVCCSDGSGTFCYSGNYCVSNGCCPDGEICEGGGGTTTLSAYVTEETTANAGGDATTTSSAYVTEETTANAGGVSQASGLNYNLQLCALAWMTAAQVLLVIQ